ncbi:hypothetical protein GX51_05228 [Blastomyces parvus]|uniref:DUF7770 domain-containing protein n=1 Tax=Blastomyces parvus TaxID=2060905 RepID=A0A2B7WY25_9EURO|nr:hypothetical protein GX51_05228 [Blastomyces parvus]
MEPVSQPSSPSFSHEDALKDDTPVRSIRLMLQSTFEPSRPFEPSPTDADIDHWSIYLMHWDNSATHVNMEAETGEEFRILKYHKLPSFGKHPGTKDWNIQITPKTLVTVSDIANRISVYRDKLPMANNSDCKLWAHTILSEVTWRKYIKRNHLVAVVEDLDRLMHETKRLELSPQLLEELLPPEEDGKD